MLATALVTVALLSVAVVSTATGADPERSNRLASYPLDELRLLRTDVEAAVLRTPAGDLVVVKEGDKVGTTEASVVRIQRDKVVLTETLRSGEGRAEPVIVVMPVAPSLEAAQTVKRYRKDSGAPPPTYLVPVPPPGGKGAAETVGGSSFMGKPERKK